MAWNDADLALVFAHAVARPDAEIDLAAAALLIAEREYPGLNVAAYLGRLDELAARCRRRGGDVAAVRALLFDELGFRGNTADYYDARNSFLSDVMDRRIGIPITLSVVFLEVGWRLGLDVQGIGYPGHFLVRAGTRILDCFRGGVEIDPAALSPPALPIAGKRAILTRILRNLAHLEPARPWLGELLAAVARPQPRRDGGVAS
jgi:regulator of sirC expression with transglutaminase-like and TPR domain